MPSLRKYERSFNTTENIVLQILSDGHFHSGEEIGKFIGISRAAISHVVRKFNDIGIEIYTLPGKGYCAHFIPDRISPRKHPEIRRLLIFDVADSTNLSVFRHPELPDGAVISAEYQTGGRGRRERKFLCLYAHQLLFSYVATFKDVLNAQGLSIVAGISVYNALKIKGFKNIGLKWPNDIYLNGMKVGGILIESIVRKENTFFAIGIGLNVFKKFIDIIEKNTLLTQKITSLENDPIATPAKLSRNSLLKIIYNQLKKNIEIFRSEGLSPFISAFQKADIYFGKDVVVKNNRRQIQGINTGITETGALKMQTEDGLKIILAGDMSLRPVI